MIVECLQEGWRSPMYAFFQAEVSVWYDEGCKYHFFKCASRKCKGEGQKGVCRYLDLKDHAATSNLKSHAVRCFSQDLVKSAFKKTQPRGHDGSIFAVFACQGQQPIKISHCAHTTEESRWALHLYFNCSHLWTFRAHIVRWCAENNHPHRIIKDCQFDILMKAGHPGISLPSPLTVLHDIKAIFEQCRERIDTILKVSLQICIMDCLFNLCIGTLQVCTFCNWRMDIPKSLGLCCLDSALTLLQKDFGILTWYHWGAKGNISGIQWSWLFILSSLTLAEHSHKNSTKCWLSMAWK